MIVSTCHYGNADSCLSPCTLVLIRLVVSSVQALRLWWKLFSWATYLLMMAVPLKAALLEFFGFLWMFIAPTCHVLVGVKLHVPYSHVCSTGDDGFSLPLIRPAVIEALAWCDVVWRLFVLSRSTPVGFVFINGTWILIKICTKWCTVLGRFGLQDFYQLFALAPFIICLSQGLFTRLGRCICG